MVRAGDEFQRKGQQGAAAVEFAIVIVILMLIVGGIVEFGRVFWCYDALSKATRDGARLMSNGLAETLLTAPAPAVSAVNEATQVVLAEATGARINPALINTQVDIQCTYLSGGTEGPWGGCHNATYETDVPVYVKVAIVNYGVNLGEWFPIWLASGSQGIVPLTLAPETVMRYMR